MNHQALLSGSSLEENLEENLDDTADINLSDFNLDKPMTPTPRVRFAFFRQLPQPREILERLTDFKNRLFKREMFSLNFLRRNKGLSIIVAALLVFSGLFYFMSSQGNGGSENKQPTWVSAIFEKVQGITSLLPWKFWQNEPNTLVENVSPMKEAAPFVSPPPATVENIFTPPKVLEPVQIIPPHRPHKAASLKAKKRGKIAKTNKIRKATAKKSKRGSRKRF